MKLRKIYLSIVSLIVLLVTSVSATFAWNIANWRVYVDSMEVNISAGDGILVSVDGVNFSQNISKTNIEKAIILKWKTDYSLGDNGDLLDQNKVKIEDSEIETLFNQIRLETVTSLDGVNFNLYNSGRVDASSGKYVSFDIYFKSLQEDTDVYFNSSSLNYDESNKQITNTKITADSVKTSSVSTDASNLKADLTTIDSQANSVIWHENEEGHIINPADAVRFSTTCVEEKEEVTKIYEPNMGLGSYATELNSSNYSESNLYLNASYLDANKNASYTYVKNSLDQDNKSKLSLENLPLTYKDFYSYESDHILNLENNGSIKKVSFNIWIEGWDADCFDAIVGSSFKVDLSFTTKAYTMYEKLKTINYHDGENIKTYNYYDFKKNFDIYLPLSNDKKFMGWYKDQSYKELFDFNSIIDSLDTTYDVYALWV